MKYSNMIQTGNTDLTKLYSMIENIYMYLLHKQPLLPNLFSEGTELQVINRILLNFTYQKNYTNILDVLREYMHEINIMIRQHTRYEYITECGKIIVMNDKILDLSLGHCMQKLYAAKICTGGK
jgi:hypothetical protein